MAFDPAQEGGDKTGITAWHNGSIEFTLTIDNEDNPVGKWFWNMVRRFRRERNALLWALTHGYTLRIPCRDEAENEGYFDLTLPSHLRQVMRITKFIPQYRIYDRYGDGDPYTDEGYIKRFRVILRAMREGLSIKLEMLNRKDNTVFVRCRPSRLEYSEKDDKFRVVTAGCRFITTVNLSRVTACSIYQGERQISGRERPTEHATVTLKIRDERNALERVMLHFAHFEKQTEKLARGLYLVRIKYDRDDEPEMVIRILSFGPLVEVIEPDGFRALIIDRLKRQRSLGLK